MSKIIIMTSAMLMVLLIFLIGCRISINTEQSMNQGSKEYENQANSQQIHESSRHGNEDPQQEQSDPIQETIKGMTLDEKIGQMMLVGIEGTSLTEQAKELIETYHVGGIILYQKNIEDTDQTLALLNELKKTNMRNQMPLFLSVDQEGGKVSRLPKEFAAIPTNEEIGRMNNRDLSFRIGQFLGEAIHSLGFNMNFAPVLDINSNPNNPVIGDRSFGAGVEIVKNLGVQTMMGMQSKSVIPVVKHFPGHGDTSVDSHLELPVITQSLQQLRDFELIPFKEAIDHKADVVMIAHILMSQIDPAFPASMSKTIISDILRKELGFDGVIITDDMTMGGIVNNYDIGEAAVHSVNAGSDIIMVAHDYDKEIKVHHALVDAVVNSVISVETVDQSVYRILMLKDKYHVSNETIHQIEVEQINKEILDSLNKYE